MCLSGLVANARLSSRSSIHGTHHEVGTGVELTRDVPGIRPFGPTLPFLGSAMCTREAIISGHVPEPSRCWSSGPVTGIEPELTECSQCSMANELRTRNTSHDEQSLFRWPLHPTYFNPMSSDSLRCMPSKFRGNIAAPDVDLVLGNSELHINLGLSRSKTSSNNSRACHGLFFAVYTCSLSPDAFCQLGIGACAS